MSEDKVHIYMAGHQEAVRYEIDLGGEKKSVMTNSPTKLHTTHCCKTRRIARLLTVQVYYDGIYFWCKQGHGCKKPKRRKR